MHTEAVARWINEREAIRMRKEIIFDYQQTGRWLLSERGHQVWGADDPDVFQLDNLTADPWLSYYRFCNVRREDDRVTRWIRQHIIEPYADHEHLWAMLAIARTINWPPTLEYLMSRSEGRKLSCWPNHPYFNSEDLGIALDGWKSAGNKVYTGAYMIRAESDRRAEWYSWSKQRYVAEIVIGKLWEDRGDWKYIAKTRRQTSAEVWDYFQGYTGWGPFMAYQVVVDLQHTRYLRDAPDVQTWAAAGPGTLRGLLRWRDGSIDGKLSQTHALELLLKLREELNQPGVIWEWLQPLDLSDVCNICCEFDKYERVRLNQGKPRSKYRPETEF